MIIMMMMMIVCVMWLCCSHGPSRGGFLARHRRDNISTHFSNFFFGVASIVLSVDAGISPYDIDAALFAFGMPMGCFQMGDMAGQDVCLNAQVSSLPLAWHMWALRCVR